MSENERLRQGILEIIDQGEFTPAEMRAALKKSGFRFPPEHPSTLNALVRRELEYLAKRGEIREMPYFSSYGHRTYDSKRGQQNRQRVYGSLQAPTPPEPDDYVRIVMGNGQEVKFFEKELRDIFRSQGFSDEIAERVAELILELQWWDD